MRKDSKSKYKSLLAIPMETPVYKAFRKICFDKEISMAQIVRWEVEKFINKNEKSVDTNI